MSCKWYNYHLMCLGGQRIFLRKCPRIVTNVKAEAGEGGRESALYLMNWSTWGETRGSDRVFGYKTI